MGDPAERARLTWRCRRGMLELDLLLGGFMARGYDAMSKTQQHHFHRLLEYPDQELLEYLLLQRAAPSRELADIVVKIRNAV